MVQVCWVPSFSLAHSGVPSVGTHAVLILPSCGCGGSSFLPALLIMLCSDSCLQMLRQLPHQRRQTKFLTNGYCDSIILSWQETFFTYYPNKYKVTEKQNLATGKTWDAVFCRKGLEGRRIIPPDLFNLSYLKRPGLWSWTYLVIQEKFLIFLKLPVSLKSVQIIYSLYTSHLGDPPGKPEVLILPKGRSQPMIRIDLIWKMYVEHP